ncbi:DUF1289 domain-containing protein [Pistricoccus aurantiacus]|uniref:DUF1289 domain-containing protein n=1 Tax=Pistricoccus aurantiacus TaxID=1883414 RepID=A0A5B8ST87_9GAMM|nr:DUF1289 domain-containing protein [Pistricoccus aurantiacus]
MRGPVTSPCVGVCSTSVGDTVCRGCQRHLAEIRDWPGYDEVQRAGRMHELDALRERVAGEFLRVTDAARLEAQLQRYRIRYRADQPALSRAVELLRVGRRHIQELSRYGLAAVGEGAELSCERLHEHITLRLLQAAEHRRLSVDDQQ